MTDQASKPEQQGRCVCRHHRVVHSGYLNASDYGRTKPCEECDCENYQTERRMPPPEPPAEGQGAGCKEFELCGCESAADGHCMYCCKEHSVAEMAAYTLAERRSYYEELEAKEAEITALRAELEAARETNTALNRRAQSAESAVAEKIQTHPTPGSFGRALANTAAEMWKREAEAGRRMREEALYWLRRSDEQMSKASALSQIDLAIKALERIKGKGGE